MIFFENLKKKVRLRYLFFYWQCTFSIRRDIILCILRLSFSWSVAANFLLFRRNRTESLMCFIVE